jgi:predicted outer membrane repeat protein
MYVITSTVDFSGQFVNNIASNSGGGLYATNSAITMTNTTIGGVAANRPNRIGPTGLNGAGMYLINNTHATLDNTDIVSNTLSNPGTGYAGGIYVRAGSAITMTNSRIQRHYLPSASDGRGAGLYIYDSTVTLNNTQVISNTANNLGGGARLFGTSTLNVLNGSSFINNRALHGMGGAIAATNSADINATNATFQSNSASGDGGAIYLDAGTLDFNGSWDVRFNTATGNGGAVAVLGTGDADFNVTGGPGDSYLGSNSAGGNGGALYVTNTDSVSLYATGGSLLALNANLAGGHGGFGYANGGAMFDVYGEIQASSNTASGNGGVFYLSNASRVWLDDYFNISPQFSVNSADNGGAIYASHSPRVELDGVEFGSSTNGNSATAGSGGAIFLSGSTLLADNCTFRNNQAQAGNGGAIAAYTSTLTIDSDYPAPLGPVTQLTDRAGPSAPLATACNPLSRQCSSLYLNTATNSTASNGNGGAIFTNGSNLTITNTYLHRNSAQRGGAIYQEGATSVGSVSNTLVYSNTSSIALGAGIRMAGGAMTLTNDTLANNIGGAGYSPGSGQSYVHDTIIWGNSVAAFGALTDAVCNIDQGGTAGPATNPQFVSPGVGEDYRLRPSSPAIDACDTGMARDLLNVPRPIGIRFDMGAFEIHPLLYLPIVKR